MYTISIRRDFIARHYLIGGDWGAENLPNSHRYVIELRLDGRELDEHGYLVDIVEIDRHMSALVDHYKDKMLNDLPEFRGLNPSLENFARIVATSLNDGISAGNVETVKVVLWESESAWAAYSVPRTPG